MIADITNVDIPSEVEKNECANERKVYCINLTSSIAQYMPPLLHVTVGGVRLLLSVHNQNNSRHSRAQQSQTKNDSKSDDQSLPQLQMQHFFMLKFAFFCIVFCELVRMCTCTPPRASV